MTGGPDSFSVGFKTIKEVLPFLVQKNKWSAEECLTRFKVIRFSILHTDKYCGISF